MYGKESSDMNTTEERGNNDTENPGNDSLGMKLRLLRFRRRHSRQTLAHAAGLEADWIGELESGHAKEVELWQLKRLTLALGIRLEELLTPPGVTPEERILLALFKQLGTE